MATFALLGHHIGYSRSPHIFKQIWAGAGVTHSYLLADTPYPERFLEQLKSDEAMRGCNVTIPYKQKVIPYLDKLSPEAEKIGAVNTIVKIGNALLGYNTDVAGFTRSLNSITLPSRALVLGTGGAAKAICYALQQMCVPYQLVSRTPKYSSTITYQQLTASVIATHPFIINCTPLGGMQYPNALPSIPYHALTPQHILYDLVYVPPLTPFLKQGVVQGCTIINGERMLREQALSAWILFQQTI